MAARAAALFVLLALAAPGVCAAQDAAPQDAPPPEAAPPETAPEAPAATRQDPYEGRLVREVRFVGLAHVDPQLVRNQIRTSEGQPYSQEQVQTDIKNLYRLGEFRNIEPDLEVYSDLTVGVVYTFVEAPIVQDVQVAGNRQLSDQDIAAAVSGVGLRAGTPVDDFRVDKARRSIEDLYRERGYYNVQVSVDEAELEESGVVLFRVREGTRIKVTSIRFVGNTSFAPREIRSQLNTKVAGLFEKGPLDDEVLDRDVAEIVRFYRNRGHLDVRADRRIVPSPDGKEAIVEFLIDEGPRYTLRGVRVDSVGEESNDELIMSLEQVAGVMEIKPGDVYSVDKIRNSLTAVREAYWQLGYTDATVDAQELRSVDAPVVDLLLRIDQGRRFRTGEIIVSGNSSTRQKVILRQVRVLPDKPLDRGAVRETEARLQSTRLFDLQQDPPQVTVQPEDPNLPGHRDVLIEVEETNTGSLGFGAAVSSDSGLIGTIELRLRNFDITDTPESFSEFFRGKAFRGGGQTFDLTLAPGSETQTYSIALTDPYLFETDNSGSIAAYLREREFDDYDEERYGTNLRLGRRVGERWVAGSSIRLESIDLSNIDADAPVDLFEVEDAHGLIGVGFELTRTTVPAYERVNPSRGARTEIGIEQVGGDFTFTKLRFEHQVFLGVYEDFLGRRGVFSVKTSTSYIPQEGEAPVYERYYLGGRSFRGFDFRGVSPRGIRNDTGTVGDDPVGGTWAFFFGLQYEHPLWGSTPNARGGVDSVLSLVGFIDTGTVTNDPGFSEYRASVGAGIRIRVPALGPAPLAFDFGFPIRKEDGDEERLLSFSVDIPF